MTVLRNDTGEEPRPCIQCHIGYYIARIETRQAWQSCIGRLGVRTGTVFLEQRIPSVETSKRPKKTKSRLRRCLSRLAVLVLLIAGFGGGYYWYVRHYRTNFHAIVDGQVYRSAQPAPELLKEWVRRYGLKTVINLRGYSRQPFHSAELQALKDVGVEMVDIHFAASRLPTRQWLGRLIEALETAERPILLHCRDGIERSGVGSVLAAMAIGGQDYATARQQLSLRYLYVGPTNRGIMELLAEYEQYCRGQKTDTGGWQRFREWATTVYRPYYFFIEIEAPEKLAVKPGEVIEMSVKITNRSSRVIPAADPEKEFELVTFWGQRLGDWPHMRRKTGPGTPLPRADIPPGQSVQLTHTLAAKNSMGKQLLHFDLLVHTDRLVTFFREGSPIATCELNVQDADTTSTSRAVSP